MAQKSTATKRPTSKKTATKAKPAKKPARTPAPPVKVAILATDFSPASLGAARAAAFVRDALGAKIVVITVLESSSDPSPSAKRQAKEWRASIQRDAQAYNDAHGLSGAKFETAEGESTTQIIMAAKQHKADLIIVGRRGSHGDKQRVLGTTARRLVRKSPVSVLVARREFTGKVRRVGVSTDFSAGADLALRRAESIASALGLPACEVLHSIEEPPGAFAVLSKKDFLDERRAAAESHVKHHADATRADGGPVLRLAVGEGRPATAISELAQEQRLDLLCMGSHGSGGTSLLLGSTAERVLDLTPCSIWLEKSRETQRRLIERLAALIE
jgi:nucleotide-binding universal stress UspA family protein